MESIRKQRETEGMVRKWICEASHLRRIMPGTRGTSPVECLIFRPKAARPTPSDRQCKGACNVTRRTGSGGDTPRDQWLKTGASRNGGVRLVVGQRVGRRCGRETEAKPQGSLAVCANATRHPHMPDSSIRRLSQTRRRGRRWKQSERCVMFLAELVVLELNRRDPLSWQARPHAGTGRLKSEAEVNRSQHPPRSLSLPDIRREGN